jgi:hypothetical protein
VTVEVFIHDVLAEFGYIRFGLLRKVWEDRGGKRSDVWKAVREMQCKLERLSKYDNALFVFPASKQENPEPAEVVNLWHPRRFEPESERDVAPVVDRFSLEATDCEGSSVGCECEECQYPTPSYARPYAGAYAGSGVGG